MDTVFSTNNVSSIINWIVFQPKGMRKQMIKNSSIKCALEIYESLKKNNFTDRQISKIAQIILALTINDKSWPN
jgi:hypothetical protein